MILSTFDPSLFTAQNIPPPPEPGFARERLWPRFVYFSTPLMYLRAQGENGSDSV
jgi:hypothetical protein